MIQSHFKNYYSITPKNFVILTKFLKKISSRRSGTETQRLCKENPRKTLHDSFAP